ncbi:MAG: 30S ribosomal protein S17 [Gammaproteobacteria bacterium]|nr:30S ribosomal protein S17 [Gammaproteobacteria bacterium]MDD9824962.1 30S ribosomal protein S17 [Gammaproteobacteria bacterium]MDD9863619.1 30S ribosomal protein S17 [Gammaproteobacteria bacterium]
MSAGDATAGRRQGKSLVGRVVSDKMTKTVAVAIDRKVKLPLYGKYVKRTTRLLAHDEQGECKLGDVVMIESCRPLSKRKSWRLLRVLAQAGKG